MDVKVRAELVDGNLDWTIDGKKPKTSIVELRKDSGPHQLDFHLDDHSGTELIFDSKGPIWVDENGAGDCPAEGIATDQITSVDCTAKKLSIGNKNSGLPRTLHYQLNFVDGRGHVQHVDPAIKNGGST